MIGRAQIASALLALVLTPAAAATPDASTVGCISGVLSKQPGTVSVKSAGGIGVQFDKPAPWVREFLVIEYSYRLPDSKIQTDKLYVTAGNGEGYEMVGQFPRWAPRRLDVFPLVKQLTDTCRAGWNSGWLPLRVE